METQSTPIFVASPPAAVNNGEASKPAPRGPRPERRVTRTNNHAKAKRGQIMEWPLMQWSPAHVITDRLLATYSIEEIDRIIIHLLHGKERIVSEKSSRNMGVKPLASRITKDLKKTEKKGPSPTKLEKIQKRREMRAEKKRAWMETKATQGGGDALAASAPGPNQGFVDSATFQEDEIDFDEV